MNFTIPEDSNLSIRLKQVLTPEQGKLLQLVASEAVKLHLPLYIVGGFVRDLLLGCPGLDLDLVVEGDAIILARAVAARVGGQVRVHSRFKTAQWLPLPEPGVPEYVDFTSARSESYRHPAALPTVKLGTLADDLCRRDFTINTLALRLDGDFFGDLYDNPIGLQDLQAGLVRVLHSESFVDDPTRLFRAVRYEQRYGFRIDSGTLAQFPTALSLIGKLSAERLRHELDMVLQEDKAPSILARLSELGILSSAHSALVWNRSTQSRFRNGKVAAHVLKNPPSHPSLGWALWLMDVPLPDLGSIDERFHFESGLRDMLLSAAPLYLDKDTYVGKKPSQCMASLDAIPLKAVQAVFCALPVGAARHVIQEYLETWRHVKPKTTGRDLKKIGLPPGPVYQFILHSLRDAWLDGEINTIDDELVLLGKLIKRNRK
jgi:tRNA nucleotidyltransferase (CCA-adding enzyme)